MIRRLFHSFVLLLLCNLVSAQIQPEKMTKKFFPEPDFKIQTPTNQKPFDQGMCTYSEMLTFLTAKVKEHPEIVRLEMLGKTPKGVEIPILYFGEGQNSKKLKIWMQGGIHGNEPAGSEGLFMLVNYLLETSEGALLLEKMDIAILPVANIDGYIAQKRTSADGFDLNRDQTKFSDPVSKIIKSAFIQWNPQAAFDFHEYTPLQKKGSNEILSGGAAGYYDVLFLPSGNLNVPKSILDISTKLFQANAEKVLEANGYTHNFYYTANVLPNGVVLAKGGNNPRSSSTNYALSNAISLLVEIRGIGLGRTSFARRTYCSFLVAKSLLETASANSSKVQKSVKNAIAQTMKRWNDVVVTADETMVNYPVKFIALQKNEVVSLDMKVKDALLPIATLTRKRPSAYLLSPDCKREVELLHILGIKVDVTDKPITLPVEGYTVTSLIKDSVKWEGVYPVTVQTKLTPLEKTFAKGSFVVKLDQKNANYAVILLEPESENGFVNMAVTNASMGNELPFYRLVKGKL